MLDCKASRGGFVSPDVTRTLISVWPFHTTLVGDDSIDMAGIKRDSVESWTAGKQRKGFRWSTIIAQHRINAQIAGDIP